MIDGILKPVNHPLSNPDLLSLKSGIVAI